MKGLPELDGSSVLIARPYDKNQLVKDKLAPEWGDFQTLASPPAQSSPVHGGGGPPQAVEGAAATTTLKTSSRLPAPGLEPVARDLAPSTMLRMVPLPRCAGEDCGRTYRLAQARSVLKVGR